MGGTYNEDERIEEKALVVCFKVEVDLMKSFTEYS
jgi:hypothetical protein